MIFKIKKIKPWSIKFYVDEKLYLIHECSDTYEPKVDFYQFIPGTNGSYELVYLAHRLGELRGYDSRTHQGETYRDIDMVQFINQLCYDGFGKYVGLSDEYIYDAIIRYKLDGIDQEIKRLEDRKAKLLEKRAEIIGSKVDI